MNSRGFTLIELMIVMAGLALLTLAMSSIFSFASKQTTQVVTRGDAQTELNEIHRDIRKAILSRISDGGSVDALSSVSVGAFPADGGTCGSVPTVPACVGVLVRQTSPLDPAGNIIQTVQIETVCETLPMISRPDIPANLNLEPEAFPTYHSALCCPSNTLPVVKIRTTPDVSKADFTDKIYPYGMYGAAVCFRLKDDNTSLSVEMVGLAQGPQTGVPIPIEKTETINLFRNSNVEILPN